METFINSYINHKLSLHMSSEFIGKGSLSALCGVRLENVIASQFLAQGGNF